MRLVSWNVNGIRAVCKKGLFTPFVEELKPDVICLQETKAQQSQSDVQLPEYEEHWNSAEKKGYSGTANFSKISPISVTPGLPQSSIDRFGVVGDAFGDPNNEGRVLTSEFADFFVVNVYTPNAKDDLGRLNLRHGQWDPAFLHHVQELESTKPVIFCGDLNVAHTPDDLANPKSNVGKRGFTSEERQGFQNFLDAGFVDTFRLFHQGNGHYSWWSNFSNARARNVGWRIDYFLVSASLAGRVTGADIHANIMGSDHCPVSLTIKP
ncbi:MAG TPA: exodeoxyribonuclease III [Acidimicrobiales bacterium]|nr:exodeoxyribonuclease III [Acidimicrobiales bacterium]